MTVRAWWTTPLTPLFTTRPPALQERRGPENPSYPIFETQPSFHRERLPPGVDAVARDLDRVRPRRPAGRLEDVELRPRRSRRRDDLAVGGDEDRVLVGPARLERHALRRAFARDHRVDRVPRAERGHRRGDLLVGGERLAELDAGHPERGRRGRGRGGGRRSLGLLLAAERERSRERERDQKGRDGAAHRASLRGLDQRGMVRTWPGWMRSGFLTWSLFAS